MNPNGQKQIGPPEGGGGDGRDTHTHTQRQGIQRWFEATACRKYREIKLRCDSRFQRAFTACSCVFKVITLIRANQRNYFENATACNKRTLKTLVAT